MSMNFNDDMGEAAKTMIKEMFCENIEAMDDRTVLLKKFNGMHSKQMGDIARAARQPVSVELNKIGDRKEIGGIVYELDEKGWRRLPIGATL